MYNKGIYVIADSKHGKNIGLLRTMINEKTVKIKDNIQDSKQQKI